MLVIYASANRDEHEWDQPDTFDIRRDATRQLGFGHGTHACAGQGLARMETQAMLRALLDRVDRNARHSSSSPPECPAAYFSSDDDRPSSRRATTSC